MQLLAVYFLKVIACSGLLLLYYRLTLRNERFHYYNRFYLLITVAASILLPLLNINWFTINSSNTSAIALLNVIYVQQDQVAVHDGGSSFNINWQQVSLLLYAGISIALLALLVWRIQKIYVYKKQYSATSMGAVDFINTDLPQAPFSFLQNLFWRNDIDLNETTGRQILQHELTHIKQKHTWDKLLMQVILSIFWINPFYWFIRKELFMLHEFIADEKAIENNDGAAFAAMLLTSQYGKSIFSPAQSFAYSPIKRRLYMLTNLTKPKYSYARRIMLLPLLAVVLLLFAFRLKSDAAKNNLPSVILNTPAAFTVIIDAGHGGTDAGMKVKSIYEKDVTLAIAKKIKELAPKYNVDVILTREGNADVSEQERVNIAASQQAAAFLSLHMDYNRSNTTSQPGITAFIANTNNRFTESRLLGSAILHNLSANFKVSTTLKQQKKPVQVLKDNPLPAVLLQCGYMDDPTDIANVTDDAKLTKVAGDILEGIASFANYNGNATSGLSPVINGDVYAGGGKDTTPKLQSIVIEGAKDTTRSLSKVLVIVDNKEVPFSTLQTLNPDDIEVMRVLKNESGVDKYGSKAANGVLEIYTKKGGLATHDKTLEEVTVVGHKLQKGPAEGLAVKDGIVIKSAAPSKDNHLMLTSGDVTIVADTFIVAPTLTLFKTNNSDTEHYEKVFLSAMQPPSFPGGITGWEKYLQRQLKASIVSDKGGPPGKYVATVSFMVDENGNLSDFKIIKDPGYGTGAEALRVIKNGPKWVPATQNGKPVKAMQQQSVTWVVTE